MRIFLILIGFFFPLAAEFQVIEDCFDLKIKTPSLQNRKTMKIKLANELEVFLISDPSVDKSAAALALNYGSWDDPKEYPGMAHFTEHMLFQGTKAYPQSNDFIHFISDRGGMYNAYTSLDRTVYMFSINNNSFLDTLERFSHFFSSPLFDPSSIKSELYAIDQEHAKNIENDSRRKFQVWKETSNPLHPNHSFATGNSQTLSKIKRDALIQWHNKHYIASMMKLIVYSNLPLKELSEKVSLFFKDTTMGQKENKIISEELTSSDQRGSFFYIKPIKNLKQITLSWELPKIFASDPTRSAELIAYALQAGQKYSLLEALRNDSLAEDLDVDVTFFGKLNLFFEITIDLTDKGVQNLPLILEKCFGAISNLKKEGTALYLFNELETMKKIKFENQSRLDSFQFVARVASDLLDENIATYPKNTIFASEYNPKNISLILDQLKPSLCTYWILADPSKTNVMPTKKEKWCNVEYAQVKMDSKKAQYLQNIEPKDIKIAPPNPFIPNSLSLTDEEVLNPLKVIENKSGLIYHFSNSFKTPEINWIFHLKTALDDAPKTVCLFDLYLKNLSEKLSPLVLEASLAGINIKMEIIDNDLILQINGFSEKAPLVLKEILKTMTSLHPTKEQFENFLSYFKMKYGNHKFDLPLLQANEQFVSLVHQNMPTNEEKTFALESITYNDLLSFYSNLFKKTYTQAMLGGNLTIKECESLWLDIQGSLASLPLEKPLQNKILLFPKGPYQIQKQSPASGSGIILSIDENPFSFKKRAAQALLATALEEPFFSALRSKQKTAYIVTSYDIELKKHLFQIFGIQSNTHSALELLYRFEIFIDGYLQEIETNIDKKRFEEIKDNLLISLKIPPKNLEEMTLLFDKLAFNYQDFEYKNKRINALSELTYDEFLKFSNDFLSRNNKKKVAILIDGKISESSIKYSDTTLKDICEKGDYTCMEKAE